MSSGTIAAEREEAVVSVSYRQYIDENDLPLITGLIDTELSEPYSIFTYRYFINNWRTLCWLAHVGDRCVGSVVCKLDMHGEMKRGYIAMLVVEKPYRKYKIGAAGTARGLCLPPTDCSGDCLSVEGTELVQRALHVMAQEGADEVVLEAEVTNAGALRLYHNLGFIRDKRLNRYYLSGVDAYRLKLLLAPTPPDADCEAAAVAAAAASSGGAGANDQGAAAGGVSSSSAANTATVKPMMT